ncbi:MAG: hypothetical protein ACLQVY_08700 [Limisphaerales bacterium]
MNFDDELELLISTRYSILYIQQGNPRPERSHGGCQQTPEKGLRMDLQHWHRPDRHFSPVPRSNAMRPPKTRSPRAIRQLTKSNRRLSSSRI